MKHFLLGALFISALCASAQDYELRVLTFEDQDYKGGTNFAGGTDWSSLIDDPQYGGTMLYGESGAGVSSFEEAYKWTDENNTWLSNALSEGYGSWCYWSGGHAISNYGSKNIADYGNYEYQLTVYNPRGTDEITRTGNGHNGSDNFAVQFGYADDSGFGLGEEALPYLEFADNEARVIDHLWITLNTYALNCYYDGNSLTAPIGENDWVKIIATGYLNDEKTSSVELFTCNGPEQFVTDWTKFDLSPLGKVTKVTFNIAGSSDNGYGFSQPAYFCYDDVAVRFPKDGDSETGIDTTCTENGQDVYYDLQGRRIKKPGNGIYIHNGKKVVIRK